VRCRQSAVAQLAGNTPPTPAHPAPGLAQYGNLELITQLFPNKCNVYARGPMGENVFHTAMLLNTPSTLAIARYLVKLYGPPLVNCPFTVGGGGEG
jgi:hypothetical protein